MGYINSGRSLDVNYSVGGSVSIDEESLVFNCTSPYDVDIQLAGVSKFLYDSSADKLTLAAAIDSSAGLTCTTISGTSIACTSIAMTPSATGRLYVNAMTNDRTDGTGCIEIDMHAGANDVHGLSVNAWALGYDLCNALEFILTTGTIASGETSYGVAGSLYTTGAASGSNAISFYAWTDGVGSGTEYAFYSLAGFDYALYCGDAPILGSLASGGDLLLVSTSHATKGDIQFHSTSYFITSAGALTVGAITGTTLEATGRLHTLVGTAEALRLSTNADDYTGFTMDANGGLTIQSVDAAAAAANIAITADGTFAITSTAFNLSGAGALSGITSIDGTGDITMGTITMPGFSVDADGDTTVKSLITAGTVDGIDVSAHDVATTGVHGVSTDYIAKVKDSQQYAVTRIIYPHFPFASYADLGGATCFPSRVGLATAAFETTAQTKFPQCTIKEIRFQVTLNEQNADSTVTLRLNGADTAITGTVAATTTGWFAFTGSVAVAENDLVSIKVVFGGAAANDFGFRGGEIVYEA